MRISADTQSDFFWQEQFSQPEIYLNDVPVEHVLEADDVAGYVRVIDYDDGGRPRYAGGAFITKTLTGTVRIEEKEMKK